MALAIGYGDISKSLMSSTARSRPVALLSKPHPCLRASMLPKRYGWGVHYDGNGRITLYGEMHAFGV